VECDFFLTTATSILRAQKFHLRGTQQNFSFLTTLPGRTRAEAWNYRL
jgi:hypothetical protein